MSMVMGKGQVLLMENITGIGPGLLKLDEMRYLPFFLFRPEERMWGGETFIGRICGMFLNGRELLDFLFCLESSESIC